MFDIDLNMYDFIGASCFFAAMFCVVMISIRAGWKVCVYALTGYVIIIATIVSFLMSMIVHLEIAP